MSPRFAQLLHHWDALFSMLPAESLQVGLLDLSLSGGRQVVPSAFQGDDVSSAAKTEAVSAEQYTGNYVLAMQSSPPLAGGCNDQPSKKSATEHALHMLVLPA